MQHESLLRLSNSKEKTLFRFNFSLIPKKAVMVRVKTEIASTPRLTFLFFFLL